MSWAITEPRGIAAALGDPRGEPRPSALGSIVEAPPLSRVERLDVYAEAYYARLLECLEGDFPTLKRVLGEDIFRGLVSEYLEAHPSDSFTAAQLGRHLPRFLETYELSEALPYLPDLGRLEWATVDAFFARELRPLDPSRLQGLDEEQWSGARLVLDPSVTLLHSRWNVDRMWDDDSEPAEEDECWLLVHRQDLRSKVARIEKLQFRTLELMAEGLELGQICVKIEESLDIDAELPPVMQWFSEWVSLGIIRDVKI